MERWIVSYVRPFVGCRGGVRVHQGMAEPDMVAGGDSLRRVLRHGVGVIGFRRVLMENN
jgi:hypothetical protein